MEIAVLLAAGLRDWIDFGVIIAILLLNAVVGWYQGMYLSFQAAVLCLTNL